MEVKAKHTLRSSLEIFFFSKSGASLVVSCDIIYKSTAYKTEKRFSILFSAKVVTENIMNAINKKREMQAYTARQIYIFHSSLPANKSISLTLRSTFIESCCRNLTHASGQIWRIQ